MKSFFKNFKQIYGAYLLWLLTSIPVITIGASTTALNYTLMQIERGKLDGSVKDNFFKSFKQNFAMSTVLFLIYAAFGALIVAGFVLNYVHPIEFDYDTATKLFSWIGVIPYSVSLSFIFGVQARFTNKLKEQLMYSIALAVRRISGSLIIIAMFAAVTALCIYKLVIGIPVALLVLGAVFYESACCYNRVFVAFMPDGFLTESEKQDKAKAQAEIDEKAKAFDERRERRQARNESKAKAAEEKSRADALRAQQRAASAVRKQADDEFEPKVSFMGQGEPADSSTDAAPGRKSVAGAAGEGAKYINITRSGQAANRKSSIADIISATSNEADN